MTVRAFRRYNLIVIIVFLAFIVGVAVWGHLFEPLELTTCRARGGQIAGDYGSGSV
jgi:hypothetical protein